MNQGHYGVHQPEGYPKTWKDYYQPKGSPEQRAHRKFMLWVAVGIIGFTTLHFVVLSL